MQTGHDRAPRTHKVFNWLLGRCAVLVLWLSPLHVMAEGTVPPEDWGSEDVPFSLDSEETQQTLRPWFEDRLLEFAQASDVAQRVHVLERIVESAVRLTPDDYDRLIPLALQLPISEHEARESLPVKWLGQGLRLQKDAPRTVRDPVGLAQLLERPSGQRSELAAIQADLILAFHGDTHAERSLRDALLRCTDPADPLNYQALHCTALNEYATLASFDLIEEVWSTATAEQRWALLTWGPTDDPRASDRMREQLREETDPTRRHLLIEAYLATAPEPDVDGVLRETLALIDVEGEGDQASPSDQSLGVCNRMVPMFDALRVLVGIMDDAEKLRLARHLYERAAPLPEHTAVCLMLESSQIDAAMAPDAKRWLQLKVNADGLPDGFVLNALVEMDWLAPRDLARIIRSGSSERWALVSERMSTAQWRQHAPEVERRVASFGEYVAEIAGQFDPETLVSPQAGPKPPGFQEEGTATQNAIDWLVEHDPERSLKIFKRWHADRNDWSAMLLSDLLRRYPEFDPDGEWREAIKQRLQKTNDPTVKALLSG